MAFCAKAIISFYSSDTSDKTMAVEDEELAWLRQEARSTDNLPAYLDPKYGYKPLHWTDIQ